MVLSACDGGAATKDEDKLASDAKSADDAAAKEKAAAEKKVADDKAAEAQAERELAEEQAYDAAKAGLLPLAKLPKKHPKGFAKACVEMLAQYDMFMKNGLAGEELAAWTAGQEARERGMRRACHNRPVEVVVCETAVLAKAPGGTELAHITRVCSEKFDVPG